MSAAARVTTENTRKAPFVAAMFDKTADISNVAQMSYVLLYVTEDGLKVCSSSVCSSFSKYEDVTEDRRAEATATRQLEFLQGFGCVDKVVPQCYDGAAVMASGSNGVQVKETTPQALLVHCYAHTRNLVMAQEATKIRACKIFFSHLSGLACLFQLLSKAYQAAG